MLNALYKNIDWSNIETIGFDMDGTLYDEYDFIVEAYEEIDNKLINNQSILTYMKNRWLEKGSSYAHIFEEAYDLKRFKIQKEEFITQALEIFRACIPQIKLSTRTENILEYMKQHYDIFLITDGNLDLQQRKFESLGLGRFFNNDRIIFTGLHGHDYYKPSTLALKFLNIKSKNIVYFGDRDIDMNFARNSKMIFKKVYNMQEIL